MKAISNSNSNSNSPKSNAVKKYQAHVNLLLENYFPLSPLSQRSETLDQAMHYSLLNGGKRLRPLLVYGAGEIVHADQDKLDNAAIAVECIHAYSLIHDDLPCMDNDDFRRGKPACHKKFDQATAILAGDALQSFAFEILSRNQDIEQISLLAKAIGKSGMALGQSKDMQHKNKTISPEKLYEIHRLKTVCLITTSVQLGFLCGVKKDINIKDINININRDRDRDKISVKKIEREKKKDKKNNKNIFQMLTDFAENFGLAFQWQDDYRDQENKNIVQSENTAEFFFEKAYKSLNPLNLNPAALLNHLREILIN